MNYQVIVTPSAKADIFETNSWLLENYPETADQWLWELSDAIVSLGKFPQRCKISDESAVFDVPVRQLFCGKRPNIYRILFSIQGEKVFILRVRSTKQRRLIDEADSER